MAVVLLLKGHPDDEIQLRNKSKIKVSIYSKICELEHPFLSNTEKN